MSPSGRFIYDSNPLRPPLNYKKPCHVYRLCQKSRHCCCCCFICSVFQFSVFVFFFFFFFFFISIFNFPTFTLSYYTLYICLCEALSKFEICGRKWIGYVIILYICLCESLSKFEICGRKWIGYVIILNLQPSTWSHFLCVFYFLFIFYFFN